VGSDVYVAVDAQGRVKVKANVKVHVQGVHDGKRRLRLTV